MQLYPAIDLKDGKCVRLKQGAFDQMKIYSNSPCEIAQMWKDAGATFLHLVDLDGALVGHSYNKEVIKEIVSKLDIPVQVGGGIRTRENVKEMLNLGVRRCIIGTKAVERPEFMKELVDEFGSDCIVAGIDAKNGMVAIEGWEKISNITALELCLTMKDFGVKHIVYTDISKDGMLVGPNVTETARLTEETGLNVIASGGVSGMDDLEQLNREGIQGAIIGKALYENRIVLSDAIIKFQK